MKISTFLKASAVMLIAAFYSAAAHAVPSAGIAFINSDMIFQKSQVLKSIINQLEQENKRLRDVNASQEKALSNEVQALEKKRSDNTISAADFASKRAQLAENAQKTEAQARNNKNVIYMAYNMSIEAMNDTLKAVAHEVADEQGYKYVLSAAAVIVTPEEADLTNKVAAKFDKKMPAYKVNFEQAKKKLAEVEAAASAEQRQLSSSQTAAKK